MTAPEASDSGGPGARRVVVTVGTDHHPFDRLIGWINDCLARHPERRTEFFAQSGTASVTPACPWSRFLGTGQLDALLDGADLIVCHGGPASIAGAWARGQVPIVVPRLRRLGEHVDDHQLDFCVQVAEVGRVRLAQTAAAFADYLDEAACDSRRFRCSASQGDVDTAVARFGALVEELVGSPARRSLLARRARRPRPVPEAGSSAWVSLPGLVNKEQE